MSDPVELLQDLVRLPSVNPMGRALDESITGEHRISDYLAQFFTELGVRWERLNVAPRRDNVLAYFESDNSPRTLMLEVHQDTVPVDAMVIDPLGAVVENGKLYGRGACDVKGGMAAMLTAFARLAKEKPSGACNVLLACTVDEEHHGLGVKHLAEQKKLIETVDFAVVAEPTNLNVVHAHKGVVRWSVRVLGKSCHSSTPEQGVNAIYHTAHILPLIENFANELSRSRIDSLLGTATLSVGRIDGGTSVNTIPDFCELEIDRRLLPGETAGVAPGQLRDYLQENALENIQYEISDPWVSVPPLSPVGSEELVEQLRTIVDRIKGSTELLAVPYGTDASTLAEAGIPSVVLGPGDIRQAHTKDEWIDLEELRQASEVYYQLALAW